MYRKQPVSLGKVIDQYLGRQTSKNAFKQGKIKAVWDLVVGPIIAQQTVDLVFYKEQIMTVYIREQVWVHEIHMKREAIRIKLNEKIGANFLNSIDVKLSRK